jgi:hypothetical protein
VSILNRVIEIIARKIYEKHVIVLLDLPWKWQVGKSYVSCLIGIFNSDIASPAYAKMWSIINQMEEINNIKNVKYN